MHVSVCECCAFFNLFGHACAFCVCAPQVDIRHDTTSVCAFASPFANLISSTRTFLLQFETHARAQTGVECVDTCVGCVSHVRICAEVVVSLNGFLIDLCVCLYVGSRDSNSCVVFDLSVNVIVIPCCPLKMFISCFRLCANSSANTKL